MSEKELKEAIEAINLHAMWMAGRAHEMTSSDQLKELGLWGGTNREERGERLLVYINIIEKEVTAIIRKSEDKT